MQHFELSREACYRALQARDPRFDGRFFTAVTTTGVYCRPICPARTPKFEHCIFVPTAAAAQQLGFRSCLRCRPEVAPGIGAWRGTATTVARALDLIAEGALDDGDVDALARRLGIGPRHLRRLFDRHVGASPLTVAQTQRILFAKRLLTESALPMADVALAAGFGSVRRFNAVMRRTYARTPRELRRTPVSGGGTGIVLKLPFVAPYDWDGVAGYLAARAIPGVELVEPARYRRTVALDGALGTVDVRPVPGANHLLATIRTDRVTALSGVVARLRRLFDLDADIATIGTHLANDPLLAPRLAARPGMRLPGAWDGFELAVRAILGQQVTVTGATTLAGRLVASFGRPLPSGLTGTANAPALLFPDPAALASNDLTTIGIPRARAAAISSLARAMQADPDLLRPYTSLERAIEALCMLPGIGTWTAQYIAMRVLREPDAFPSSDLGLLRAIADDGRRPTPAELEARAEAWRPWRAYAAVHLWAGATVTLLRNTRRRSNDPRDLAAFPHGRIAPQS